jgi:hypothetical protein
MNVEGHSIIERRALAMSSSRSYMYIAHEVFLRGIMEAPDMDADSPKPSINLAQHELDRSRADWSAEKIRRAQREAQVNWAYPSDTPAPDQAD